MDNFSEHLSGFTEHLRVKNYSPATIDAYTEHLQFFFEYLDESNITDIKRVTRDVLKTYQLRITESGGKRCSRFTPATVSVKLRAVKRFFLYLEETNAILINPAEYLREPESGKRLPKVVLTEEEARKVLDQPNLSTMSGIRDRAILEVFYSTGIRLEEMVSLTIYDCDLQGGLLRVNKGKFAKDRVVPLGKHAVRFLKEYITQIRPQHTKKNKTVRTMFVNKDGEPLSKQMIEIRIRRYTRQAGIQKQITPHTFRHTFATELIKNGADITAVQKMLGHARLKTTYIYTKVAGVEVKKTHSKHHPREKDKAVKEEIADGKGIRRNFRWRK
ncbi:MAG: tyrosine-type recombinase/integrase [Nitrospirota bacterium]